MAEVSTLVIEVGSASINKAVSDLQNLTTTSRTAEDAIDGLSTAFKTLAGAMVIREMAEMAKNTILLAARYETLGATLGVMANNAGSTADEMRTFQLEIEKTGISAIKARQSLQTMAAAQLDLKGSMEGGSNAAKLARVAQDAAVIAGINSSDAFNNLVRGIATGESRIIRHMGIMVNFNNAIDQAAHVQGRLRSSFNSTELANIRLSAALEEGAKRAGVYEAAMTTAGKQMLSMQRYTENLQVKIGELFNPATNAVVFELVRVFREADEAMNEWAKSGGKAAWAAELKETVKGVIEGLKTFGGMISDSAASLKLLGAAYLAIKLGAFVSQLMTKVAATWADVTATRASVAMKNAEAQATLVQAQREYFLAQKKFEKMQVTLQETSGQILSNKTRAEAAIISTRMILAEESLTIAKQKATAATLELAAAQTTGQKIMSMLGGPVGVAILALTALVAAFNALKDSTIEDNKGGTLAAKDKMTELVLESERAKKMLAALAKSGGDVKKAMKEAFDPKDLPEIRKLSEEIDNLQRRFNELANPGMWEKIKGGLRDAFAGPMAPLGAFGRALGMKNNAQIMADIAADKKVKEQQQKDLAEQNANTKKINDEKEAALIAARKISEIEAEKTKSALAAKNELAKLEEQIALEKLKGMGYSTRALAVMKDELDYKKAIEVIDNKIAEAQRTKNGEAVAYLKQQKEAQGQLLVEKLAAEKRIDQEKRKREEMAAEQQSVNDLTTALEKYEEENTKIGHGEEELIRRKWAAIGLNEATIELMNREIAALREREKLQDNEKQRRDAESYASQLNKGKSETEDALARLNAANQAIDKHTHKVGLLSGVYAKEWMKIMSSADTFAGTLYQTSERLFSGIGDAIGQMVTGAQVSFKSMMSSLAADIARFMANKAVMEFFKLAVSWYLGSGTSGGVAGANGVSDAGGNAQYGMRAEGGSVSSGSMYMVGEKGPELFVPGSNGSIVPNHALGGNVQAGDTTISVVVHMENSDKDNAASNSDNGRQVGLLITSAVRAAIIDEKRPGGLLFAGA